MRIIPGWRPRGQEVQRTDSGHAQQVTAKPFSDMLRQQNERATAQQLNRMLEEIQRQSQRLAASMTVRELRIYKQLVRRFLEETARRGVGLKETRGWDRRGRAKRYKLVEEIDNHLLSMAEDLLASEEGRIELLQKVGEIRGMLINLMF